MTELKKGDRVRVEFDAEVIDSSNETPFLMVNLGMPYGHLMVANDHCTVLAPPIKVGDMLDKTAAVRSLPIGSTVRGYDDQVPAHKFDEDVWHFANGLSSQVNTGAIRLPAKVLEIGDWS